MGGKAQDPSCVLCASPYLKESLHELEALREEEYDHQERRSFDHVWLSTNQLESNVPERKAEMKMAGLRFACSPRPLLAAVSTKSSLLFSWRGVMFARMFGEEEVHRENECWIERGEGSIISGRIYVTNFRLVFLPEDFDLNGDCLIEVPHASIVRIDKSWTTPMSFGSDTRLLVIETKTDNSLRFRFRKHSGARRRLKRVLLPFVDAPPVSIAEAYARAFDIARRKDPSLSALDSVADAQFNFVAERQRLGISSRYRVTTVNEDYRMCTSYPKRFIVPADVTDETLMKVAQFRRKGRVPAVVWCHPLKQNRASLSRCSQPLVGLKRARCLDDENMLRSILLAAHSPENESTNPDQRGKQLFLRVFDARPRVNAMANTMKGAGYEDVEVNYNFCSIEFLNIENIHVIRDSYQKVLQLFDPTSSIGVDDSRWLSNVESTGWLHHIRTILKGSVKIAQCLEFEGWPALVHCSDGWDRTSQLTALVQIMLDPFFRTIKGFCALVEKEWVAFGHKFADRLGYRSGLGSSDEFSPVFVQFLDALHQIVYQFPTAFEYTAEFLIAIAQEIFFCRRGKDVHDKRPLISLWYDAEQCREQFINESFDETKHMRLFGKTLFPSTRMRHLRLWVEFFDEPARERDESK